MNLATAKSKKLQRVEYNVFFRVFERSYKISSSEMFMRESEENTYVQSWVPIFQILP